MEKEKWGNDGVVERELLVDEAGAVHVVDDAGGRGAEGVALVVEIDDEVIDGVLGGVNKRNQRERVQNEWNGMDDSFNSFIRGTINIHFLFQIISASIQ